MAMREMPYRQWVEVAKTIKPMSYGVIVKRAVGSLIKILPMATLFGVKSVQSFGG